MDNKLWKQIDQEEPIPEHIKEKMKELKKQGETFIDEKYIKRPTQIEGMRKAGKVNTELLDEIGKIIRVGMSTQEIDDFVVEFTKAHNGICAPLGYQGYPKSVCTSINHEVCHGIPSRLIHLHEGDIVNVDCTTIIDGYYADASRMYYVGEVSPERKKLVEETKKCLEIGIEAAKPWAHLGDIGEAINSYAQSKGYSVVRALGGHGVGIEFHEDPFVAHIGKKNTGEILVPGMTITIEPMINAGVPEVYLDAMNGWTVYTQDHKDSAQWEHTILITEEGNEIITH